MARKGTAEERRSTDAQFLTSLYDMRLHAAVSDHALMQMLLVFRNGIPTVLSVKCVTRAILRAEVV